MVPIKYLSLILSDETHSDIWMFVMVGGVIYILIGLAEAKVA